MDREQLDRMMGPPSASNPSRIQGEEELRYDAAQARVVMRDGRTVEVSLAPPSKVLFQGAPLFEERDVWRQLVVADGEAQEVLGFILLPSLGLTLTGFHDGDTSQLAITAFEKGRWDRLAGEMKPFGL